MKELDTALLECQKAIKPIFKSSKGNYGQFANYEDIMIAARPHMLANNLRVSHHRRDTDTGLYLQTIIKHTPSGQFIDDLSRLVPEKMTPASVGAATTYAKRTSFVNLMGIVTTDEDGVDYGGSEGGVIDASEVQMMQYKFQAASANAKSEVAKYFQVLNIKYMEDLPKHEFKSVMNILDKK